jgi:3'(2'), 5'-bisphosphate nucleotidase
MQHHITPTFLQSLVHIAQDAAAAIMTIYPERDTWDVQEKGDHSPLTAADLAANAVIAKALPLLLDVPIVSEEMALPSFAERAQWSAYWLVDPLDGTKEFIAGNGQFTVNIALIVNGTPMVGVVTVPPTQITYLGVNAAADADSLGAWKYDNGRISRIHVRDTQARFDQGLPLAVLMSHRHASPETLALMARVADAWPGEIHTVSAGSSLKFCVIAEGGADLYPRLAPTSEWDTGAAQAVLVAAGGSVVQATDGQALAYNAKDSILNPFFIATGDKNFAWENLF